MFLNQNGSTNPSDCDDRGNGVAPVEAQPNNPPQVQDAYGDSGLAGPNLGQMDGSHEMWWAGT